MIGGLGHAVLSFSGGSVTVSAAGLTPLVTHKVYSSSLTTYKLADYTEELAAAVSPNLEGGGFTREWCVEFCASRLGDGFNADTCEYTTSIG